MNQQDREILEHGMADDIDSNPLNALRAAKELRTVNHWNELDAAFRSKT